MESSDKLFSVQLPDDGTGCARELTYTQTRLEIPYITKEGKVEQRPVVLSVPADAKPPVPLVFVAHYEMDSSAKELKQYISNGWAVATTTGWKGIYNEQLSDNDLVFNNAALYTLRGLPEIDRDRIAVVGISAGGYMTLMLNGLQLGICCCVADSPLCNLHFNFHTFFKQAAALHDATWAALTPEQREEAKQLSSSSDMKEVRRGMSMAKFPILRSISDGFLKCTANFPDTENSDRAAALSPIGHAGAFSAPFVINHYTSDALVPVDQISRRFTYPTPGSSLPQDFCTRLPDPPKALSDHSLEELLPADRVTVNHLPTQTAVIDQPFDSEKDYTINIYDEGPMESFSGHRLIDGKGGTDSVLYLREMLQRGGARTIRLSAEKLRLLLQRYRGESIPLPPHEGIDDTAYGSLAVYRKEIVCELRDWMQNHSETEYRAILGCLTADEQDPALRDALTRTGEEILAEILSPVLQGRIM